jgi:uncharacterized membrane protein (Fun14 family)
LIDVAFEDIIFSAGGGFLLGALAGYAVKKLMKLAAIVLGLFVVGLAYLSYRGWVDVKWVAIENTTKSTLINMTNEAVHTLNDTASHFQVHPSSVGSIGLPIAAAFGFMPGLIFGLRRG